MHRVPCSRLQALGWVALLLPTHEALRGQGAWGAWAPRWLELWQVRLAILLRFNNCNLQFH